MYSVCSHDIQIVMLNECHTTVWSQTQGSFLFRGHFCVWSQNDAKIGHLSCLVLAFFFFFRQQSVVPLVEQEISTINTLSSITAWRETIRLTTCLLMAGWNGVPALSTSFEKQFCFCQSFDQRKKKKIAILRQRIAANMTKKAQCLVTLRNIFRRYVHVIMTYFLVIITKYQGCHTIKIFNRN